MLGCHFPPALGETVVIVLFVMLFRGDFGAIMHIDIHPALYVTNITVNKFKSF
jgi:hypothetical protein